MSHITIIAIKMNTDKTMNPREGRKSTKGHILGQQLGYKETWAFWSYLRAPSESDSAEWHTLPPMPQIRSCRVWGSPGHPRSSQI